MLVIRNVARNLRRLAPMIVIITAVFVVMVVGNAVLAASGDALYTTYGRLVAGDVSVSADAESNFTVFGSDQLLIGEYLVQPTVPEYEDLLSTVLSWDEVRTAAGLVSGVANVNIGGARKNKTVFGVDFSSYRELFPDLELVAGRFPAPGQPGVVVQEDRVPADGDVSALLESPALLAGTTGRSFTLREAPVTGVFRYPVDDELLNGVILADVETVRALNGYLYGALDDVDLTDEDAAVLGSDVDDLFGSSDALETDPASEEGVDIASLLGGASTSFDAEPVDAEPVDAQSTERARTTVAGAWNFLLIDLHNPADGSTVMRRLEREGFTPDAGYRVRDWYRTVGGNASLVRYLQLMFNAGLIFVAVGAAIIATNALVLSVLERTGEIGTMRALGAGRGRVSLMIGLETLVVVMGAAILGIVAGTIATEALNGADYVVNNRYIAILFGGEPIRGAVTSGLVGAHLLAAAGLSACAVVYPLKKALGVSPREAMAT